MFCSKCGNSIPDTSKFCPECGLPLKATSSASEPNSVTLRCSDCHGIMTVSKDKTVVTCPYCGSKKLIMENDPVAIQRLKSEAFVSTKKLDQEIELERLRTQRMIEEEKIDKVKREEKSNNSWLVFGLSLMFGIPIILVILINLGRA